MTPDDPEYFNGFVQRLAAPIHAISDEFDSHWNMAIATLMIYTIEKGGRGAFEVLAHALDLSVAMLPEHGIRANGRRQRQMEKKRLRHPKGLTSL